jgi:CRP-like cAMP-binding protein
VPPSIPPAKGSDPEDVAWALQTADALWRRSERTDALSWLRRAVQAAGEADDPERAFALADAAAELTEQLSNEPPAPEGAPRIEITSSPPPRLHPDASGSVDISMEDEIPEVSARFAPSFPPGAGAEIDDLLGGASQPPPSAVPSAPPSAPDSAPLPPPPQDTAKARPPPLPPRRNKLPPARLPPPPSTRDVTSVSVAPPESSGRPSRPIPLPRGALFEDSTPFLPRSESDEHESASSSSRSGEHLATGFDSLVRKPSASPPPVSVRESEPPVSAELHQFTVPAPPQFTEPPPEILRALDEPAEQLAEPAQREAPAEPPQNDATDAPAAIEIDGRLRRIADADAFVDLPDDARDLFVAAGTVHSLSRDEEVPAVALCYVLEGEVRVSSAVVDAAGLILKPGEVLRARGTIEANLPLRLSAHSDEATVVTWNSHSVEDAFASCPWVEGDLRAIANRTLAICGATIGPLGERLDESIFLDVMSRFEVSVLLPGEVLVEKGAPLPGLCIVGVGDIQGEGEQGPGDFVFAQGVLSLSPAPATFKAGKDGALVLVATRAVTQEILVTCPPLLEILAGM